MVLVYIYMMCGSGHKWYHSMNSIPAKIPQRTSNKGIRLRVKINHKTSRKVHENHGPAGESILKQHSLTWPTCVPAEAAAPPQISLSSLHLRLCNACCHEPIRSFATPAFAVTAPRHGRQTSLSKPCPPCHPHCAPTIGMSSHQAAEGMMPQVP